MRPILIFGLLLMLCGCAQSVDSQLQGDWKQTAQGNSLLEQLVAGMLPKTQLTLKSDHTFSLLLPTLEVTIGTTSTSATSQRRVEGTWKVDGRSAIFTCVSTGGKPVDQVRQELADAKVKSAQEEHDRLVQQAVQRQMLAAQGYAPDSQDSSTNASTPPQPPSWLKSSDELVLPAKADLSDDGKKLTLRFEGDAQQALDLQRGD